MNETLFNNENTKRIKLYKFSYKIVYKANHIEQ